MQNIATEKRLLGCRDTKFYKESTDLYETGKQSSEKGNAAILDCSNSGRDTCITQYLQN